MTAHVFERADSLFVLSLLLLEFRINAIELSLEFPDLAVFLVSFLLESENLGAELHESIYQWTLITGRQDNVCAHLLQVMS